MRVCVQTWIMKEFPEVMVIATISCSFVVALSAIVAFVVEQGPFLGLARSQRPLAVRLLLT